MLPEGNWITRAPSLRRKAALLAKVQDEGGHGLYLYAAAETLGISREELVEQLLAGKAKYSSIFNYPALTWADIGAIGWLVDGAAIMNQIPLCRCSYGPYARAMIRICKEEMLPPAPGLRDHADAVPRHARAEGDGAGRLGPLVVAVPDDVRPAGHGEPAQRHVHAAGRSSASPTTTLRQKFVDATVPQGHYLGLTFPDPELKFDEASGHWQFGDIDWEEFRARARRQRPVQSRAPAPPAARPTTTAPGCARRRWRMPGSAPIARQQPG